MSSKLVSSQVHAVYFDEEEDITYIFASSSTDGFIGVRCEGAVTLLDAPADVLKSISQQETERLKQLKSIEEASNARSKTEGTGEATGQAT